MDVTREVGAYTIIAPNEALISWKHDAVTRQIKQIVDEELRYTGERMASGETVGEHTLQDTGRAVGYADALKFVQELLNFDFVVEKKEDEDNAEKDSAASR